MISSETSVVEYTANGVTVQFPVPFMFLANSDLAVRSTVGGVQSTLTLDVDYTVTGVGVEGGGTVTFNLLSPPASGAVIKIERTVANVQNTSFRTQGSFSPAVHEQALDYRTMVEQQLDRRVSTLEGLGAGSSIGFGGPPLNVTKAAAVVGTSTFAARDDHKHDVSTAAAVGLTDATNAEGNATSLARSNHTHAHGDRGGGTLHAVATPSAAGFISALDKAKLNSFLYVEDYGAVGDGDTDDYTAIRNAIDAAAALHCDVYFKAKPYVLGQELQLFTAGKHVSLIGTTLISGEQTTLKAGQTGMRSVAALRGTHFIKNIVFDANRLATYALYFNGCSNSSFEGVAAQNSLKDGVHLSGVDVGQGYPINDSNIFRDFATGLCGTAWLTADVAADGPGIPVGCQIASASTCSVTSGSAAVIFTSGIDVSALGLRPNDFVRVGLSSQKRVVMVVSIADAHTIICDQTFDYTASLLGFAICSGDGYHEAPHADNNLNSFEGRGYHSGNVGAAFALHGFYGGTWTGAQQIQYCMYGFRIGGVGGGTSNLGGVLIRPYFEGGLHSGKPFKLIAMQDWTIVSPLDLGWDPSNPSKVVPRNADFTGGVVGSETGRSALTGIYINVGGVFPLGASPQNSYLNARTANSCMSYAFFFEGRGLSPGGGYDLSLTGSTLFYSNAMLWDPGGSDRVLSGTPTISFTGVDGHALTVITCAPTGVNTITLQDERVLPGSKLLLNTATVVLRPGDVLVLWTDGLFWREVARSNGGHAIGGVCGEDLNTGDLVCFDDDSGTAKLFKADANGSGERRNPVGAYTGGLAFAGTYVSKVYSTAEHDIPDGRWIAVPAAADAGKRAYLSTTAGKWTLTAPSTTGDTIIRMGTVTRGGTGAVKVAVDIGEASIAP